MNINKINQQQNFTGAYTSISGYRPWRILWENLATSETVAGGAIYIDVVGKAAEKKLLTLSSQNASLKLNHGDHFFNKVDIDGLPVLLTNEHVKEFESMSTPEKVKQFFNDLFKGRIKFSEPIETKVIETPPGKTLGRVPDECTYKEEGGKLF